MVILSVYIDIRNAYLNRLWLLLSYFRFIWCLFYMTSYGFQNDKASFHNGRSINAAAISLQYNSAVKLE
ncbi:hypothetical protein CR513_62430, partial [Mucuna pruriens]